MKRSFLWLAHALAIVLLAALIVAVPGSSRLRRGANNFVQNFLYRTRGAQPGDPRIVLAAIDDESISRIGGFPWRRSVAARLIEHLTQLGARTIAFDVLYLDPSAHPEDDQALAEAIQRSGRVILGEVVSPGKGGATPQRQEPLPLLARGAAGLGDVSVTGEVQVDGAIRSYATKIASAGLPDAFPLAVVAVAHFLGQDPQRLAARLPARLRLNYRGPWDARSFRAIPVCHILDDQLTPDETAALREALVFVGSVSSQAFDLHPSPFGGQMPGPLAQLTLADNILDQRWLASLRPSSDLLLCAVPLALFLVFCASLSSASYLAGLAGAALACLLAAWLSFSGGIWLRPAVLLTSFLVSFLWTLFARKSLNRGG
jgi:CHASE2 domain-containing sensor protein